MSKLIECEMKKNISSINVLHSLVDSSLERCYSSSTRKHTEP